MTLTLPKTCSMGSSKTGLVGTIGVTLLNPDGTTHTARTTAGIYEIGGGCYGKDITFPDDWKGSLKWDTGGGSPVYASEDYEIEGLIQEIRTQTDKMNFTGTDIKSTLDGEEVTTDAASRTASKATGYATENPPSQVLADYKADVANLDVAVSTRNATTPPTPTEIRTELEAAGTKITAIKDKTGNLPSDPADQSLLEAAIATRAPANEYDTEMSRIPSDLVDVPTAAELIAAHGSGAWTPADVSALATAAAQATAQTALDFLTDEAGGRWEIVSDQMVFYKTDGSELMRFNLFDAAGVATMKNVFKRERV